MNLNTFYYFKDELLLDYNQKLKTTDFLFRFLYSLDIKTNYKIEHNFNINNENIKKAIETYHKYKDKKVVVVYGNYEKFINDFKTHPNLYELNKRDNYLEAIITNDLHNYNEQLLFGRDSVNIIIDDIGIIYNDFININSKYSTNNYLFNSLVINYLILSKVKDITYTEVLLSSKLIDFNNKEIEEYLKNFNLEKFNKLIKNNEPTETINKTHYTSNNFENYHTIISPVSFIGNMLLLKENSKENKIDITNTYNLVKDILDNNDIFMRGAIASHFVGRDKIISKFKNNIFEVIRYRGKIEDVRLISHYFSYYTFNSIKHYIGDQLYKTIKGTTMKNFYYISNFLEVNIRELIISYFILQFNSDVQNILLNNINSNCINSIFKLLVRNEDIEETITNIKETLDFSNIDFNSHLINFNNKVNSYHTNKLIMSINSLDYKDYLIHKKDLFVSLELLIDNASLYYLDYGDLKLEHGLHRLILRDDSYYIFNKIFEQKASDFLKGVYCSSTLFYSTKSLFIKNQIDNVYTRKDEFANNLNLLKNKLKNYSLKEFESYHFGDFIKELKKRGLIDEEINF